MTTYFDTLATSYVDVPLVPGVDTLTFLQATEGLIKMFDLLGAKTFAIVQSDLSGNVAKIRNRFLATPDKSATLESLIENEKPEKERTATEGLLWLLRGLQFTQIALTRAQKDKSEELTTSFTEAYALTLKKYHNWMVKPIFTMAMKACPYRKDFYAKLGSPIDVVETELDKWLGALANIISIIQPLVEGR